MTALSKLHVRDYSHGGLGVVTGVWTFVPTLCGRSVRSGFIVERDAGARHGWAYTHGPNEEPPEAEVCRTCRRAVESISRTNDWIFEQATGVRPRFLSLAEANALRE